MTSPITESRRSAKLDPACAEAVELARAAAVETAGEAAVGDYLGREVSGDRLVTHLFGCNHAGYVGWRWAVTVVRAARQRVVTVNEVVLLPGPEALVAPEWVPWTERVRPEDVGAGNLLPAPADDPRLVPGYTGADQDLRTDETLRAVYDELGLGRERVLSVTGRDAAAERWYAGDHGPEAPVARAAPAPCATCGFLVPLAGGLAPAFGVCANEYSPSDGQVVSLDHGCGAHSQAIPSTAGPAAADPAQPVYDTFGRDPL